MTSMQTLRKKVEKLEREAAITSKKTAFTWLESGGFVYPHKNNFSNPDQNLHMTPEEYEAKMKALGYTDFIYITWCEREKLQKPDGSNHHSEYEGSVQFLPREEALP